MAHRIVLYSHDSVGLGHVARNMAIAHALDRDIPALTGESVTGLLITGRAVATGWTAPAGWDWLVLPGVTRTSDGYAPRHLRTGMPRLTSIRANLVRVALAEFEPDLVIIDRHAFGIGRELESAITQLRAERPSCRIVLGLREVLDSPEVAAREWESIGGAAAIRRHFDAIWVYGDPGVHDPVASGEVPLALADLVEHTGYLAAGRDGGRPTPPEERPFILTTVGGGSDGARLTAAAAGAEVPDGYDHLVVAGPEMPAESFRLVSQAAGPRTTVVRSVPDAAVLAERAAAVVSMGGYNTVCELLSTTTPALVVPRVHRRLEQLIRAESLAARDALDVVHPDDVTAGALATWLRDAVGRSVDRTGLDLDGLTRVAALAADALTVPTTREAAHAI